MSLWLNRIMKVGHAACLVHRSGRVRAIEPPQSLGVAIKALSAAPVDNGHSHRKSILRGCCINKGGGLAASERYQKTAKSKSRDGRRQPVKEGHYVPRCGDHHTIRHPLCASAFLLPMHDPAPRPLNSADYPEAGPATGEHYVRCSIVE